MKTQALASEERVSLALELHHRRLDDILTGISCAIATSGCENSGGRDQAAAARAEPRSLRRQESGRYLWGCILSAAWAIEAGIRQRTWTGPGSGSRGPRGTSRKVEKLKFSSEANPVMLPALSMETTSES